MWYAVNAVGKCSGKAQSSMGVVTLFTSKQVLCDGSSQFKQVSNRSFMPDTVILMGFHHIYPHMVICGGVHFSYFFSDMHVVPGTKLRVVPYFFL